MRGGGEAGALPRTTSKEGPEAVWPEEWPGDLGKPEGGWGGATKDFLGAGAGSAGCGGRLGARAGRVG